MGQLDQYPLRIQRAEGREISEAEIEGEEGEEKKMNYKEAIPQINKLNDKLQKLCDSIGVTVSMMCHPNIHGYKCIFIHDPSATKDSKIDDIYIVYPR
jgi:hypothetical protein